MNNYCVLVYMNLHFEGRTYEKVEKFVAIKKEAALKEIKNKGSKKWHLFICKDNIFFTS